MNEVAAEEETLARHVLAALSDSDTTAFGALAAEEIEIHTSRGVRRGHAEAIAWAASKYDHLQRRYVIDELRPLDGGGLLMLGASQYVWKDSGEVADSSPVAVELHFDRGKLLLWRFREDLRGEEESR